MPETYEDLQADRDEWRRQHENLLSVKEQDTEVLLAKAEKYKLALGDILDYADALYQSDRGNETVHRIFNLTAQALGYTRRLPDVIHDEG